MSAVTAVPIQPLPKGSVLKLWIGVAVLVAAGLALAWFGTRGLQRERTESGMQYQVVEAGDGPSITDADLVQFHLVARRPDGGILMSSLGREPLAGSSANSPIPAVGEALRLMRPGSRYRIWVPVRLAFQGTLPPEARLQPDDLVNFEIQVVNVLPGMAAMQSMMGGPGGPGGPGMAPGGADPHAGLPPEAGAPGAIAPEPEGPAGNEAGPAR